MPETRKIICPNPDCKVILTVGYFPGIENKNLTCPKCHTTHKFTEFLPYTSPEGQAHQRQQVPVLDSDLTDLHNVIHQNNNYRQYASDETQIRDDVEYHIGWLQLDGLSAPLQLKMGENVIGRKAGSSSATVQIPDPSNRMSRMHFLINVVRQEGKGNFHLISLLPGPKNKSFVNDTELPAGDEYILHHGDKIRVGDLTITFVEH